MWSSAILCTVSCGVGGMPGEEGLITGLLCVQLAPWYVCAVSHRLIWLWSEGKEADLCVGIPTPACTCWSSPRCMAVSEESRWSGALQQFPSQARSCATAGDVCWGTNPALDLLLPKGAEGVEKAGKQTQVVVSAMSSCPSFLPALPHERLTCSKPSSNRDPKQGPG